MVDPYNDEFDPSQEYMTKNPS
jgi:hypothetical protein